MLLFAVFCDPRHDWSRDTILANAQLSRCVPGPAHKQHGSQRHVFAGVDSCKICARSELFSETYCIFLGYDFDCFPTEKFSAVVGCWTGDTSGRSDVVSDPGGQFASFIIIIFFILSRSLFIITWIYRCSSREPWIYITLVQEYVEN